MYKAFFVRSSEGGQKEKFRHCRQPFNLNPIETESCRSLPGLEEKSGTELPDQPERSFSKSEIENAFPFFCNFPIWLVLSKEPWHDNLRSLGKCN